MDELIERLLQAAYDSGYECGVGRSGQSSHGAAITRRKLAKRDLEAAIAEQQARLAKAVAALDAVEWCTVLPDYDWLFCPWCGKFARIADAYHADDCQRQDALKEE